ncbi:glycosyltransferase family 2 protein [Candidatus Woesearchaeota archaeon]|nr:glycosyltransferase family 2 protein [Candidatus Woesearchaeota archaeon]
MNIILNGLLWFSYLMALYFAIFWLYSYIEKRTFFKSEKSITNLKEFPFVSVIVPAHNEQDSVEGTARSILAINYPKARYELIMVNDGSRDRTLDIMKGIKRRFPNRNIRIISHKNVGKAASMNKAIASAKGEYFACLDADSFVDKDALRKMISMHQNDPSIAAVTPAMKVTQANTFLQKLQRLEYIMSIFYARIMGHMDMIYVAPGPFSVYKKDIIQKIGGFDKNSIVEDQEIGYRIQKHHYRLRQCFDAYSYTIAPKSLKGLYKQRNRWYKGGILTFLQYRKLLFNKKYGDFGIFQMPSIISMYFWAAFACMFFVYFTYEPIAEFFHKLVVIKFNILPHIITFFQSDLNVLNFAANRFSIFFVVIAFMLLLLYIAHRNAKEKMRIRDTPHIVPYLFLYFPLLGGIVFIVIAQTLMGKKQKW